MCGICGIISFTDKPIEENRILKIINTIKHRGPDDEGYFIDNKIGLGHVRLSIIDLTEAGHQPMYSNDNNYVIVYNGELYNYLELKKELSSGYEFISSTDTEVILAAYREWGEKCLSRFNGMFAFAIYDKQKEVIFAARDRYGIKPFYYYQDEETFVFCSEIKGILSIMNNKAVLNEEALYDFVVFNRTDHSASTCFKNIYNLRPGHFVIINPSAKTVNRSIWYFLPEIEKKKIDKENCIKELYDKLLNSIKLHLVSDVPVGSALSGGIDSSGIVSLMKEVLPSTNQISAFSAVYDPNWEKDETKYINEIVKSKDLKLHLVYPVAEELHKEIDELIYHQEEPFASASMFASWKVYEEANKRNIKVLLNGQGADELFAYDYMAAFYFQELFYKIKWIKLIKEILLFHKKQAASGFTLKLFLFLISPEFLKNKLITFSDNLVNKEFFKKYINQSDFNRDFFNSRNLNENVRNHLLMKLHHLLRIEDKNSMRFSVEARVPYLEYQLVEYAMNIPSKYKVYKGEVKYILKQSLKKLLPKLIFERNNKIGYETPMDKWFRSECLANEVESMLKEENQVMERYLNITYIRQKWQEQVEGKNNAMVIWKYYYLTKWYKRFFL